MARISFVMFLADKEIWWSDKRGFQSPESLFNDGVTLRLK